MDARLRSKPFNADTASIQLEELGLHTRSLRSYLKERAKYLRARDRFERIKRWVHPADTADDLDRKMMAAVARAETADASAILLKAFAALVAEGGDLGARPKMLDELASFDLELGFWSLVDREFGYREPGEEPPALRGLTYRLFATDFCSGTRSTAASLTHFVISDRAKAAHASAHSGTLDHYLPKKSFPAFAVFSKNLIPACTCNNKRGVVLVGAGVGERVLHPYFDECLSERLIRAQFDDLGAVPRVSIAMTVPKTHPNYAAIAFHVLKIVESSAIKGYLGDQWSAFYREPRLVVRALSETIATRAELQAILESERALLDDLHRGKNSWNSVFVSGLLEPVVLDWLIQRLSVVGRLPDNPLE